MVSVAGFATEKAAGTSSDGRGSAGELKRKTVASDGRSELIYKMVLRLPYILKP
jgi:hypothetical protein